MTARRYLAGMGMVVIAGALYRVTAASFAPRMLSRSSAFPPPMSGVLPSSTMESGSLSTAGQCDCGPLWECLSGENPGPCDSLEQELRDCLAKSKVNATIQES